MTDPTPEERQRIFDLAAAAMMLIQDDELQERMMAAMRAGNDPLVFGPDDGWWTIRIPGFDDLRIRDSAIGGVYDPIEP